MWKPILAISLGAALGALLRWQLGLRLNTLFPSLRLGTLTANLIGGYLVAREMGLPGATVIAGSEGYGQHLRIHSSHFFELTDQPQEIQMAASEADTERLFERPKAEGAQIFYVMSPVEFGMLGGPGS